jgi:cephalosporin hydroxylase
VSPDRPSLEGPAIEFTKAYWEDHKRTWANTYWLGVPAQQLPLDLWVLQEIIFETRPGLVLETGTKFGGSALFIASVLDLLGSGEVITIDIDQRRVADQAKQHSRIEVVEGDSAGEDVAERLARRCEGAEVMAILDSDHHAPHVARELDLYGGLVSPGCYLVVQDTIVNGNPISDDFGPGPAEAIEGWLPDHPEFEVDRTREKFMATFQPGGYLLRR